MGILGVLLTSQSLMTFGKTISHCEKMFTALADARLSGSSKLMLLSTST